MLSPINQNYKTPSRQDIDQVPTPSVSKEGGLDGIENNVAILTERINDIKSWPFLKDEKRDINILEEKLEGIKGKHIELKNEMIKNMACKGGSDEIYLSNEDANMLSVLFKESYNLGDKLDTFKKEYYKKLDVYIVERAQLLKEANFIKLDIDIDNLRVLEAQNPTIVTVNGYIEKRKELWEKVDELSGYFSSKQICNSENRFRDIAQLCIDMYTLHQAYQ